MTRETRFGAYRLLDRISVGGMAEVFRAERDGRVAFRADPMWFTDYYRREGIE